MATRILLVEDDPIIVEALTELLVGEGYAVDHAARQDEAIELALGGANAPEGHTSPASRAVAAIGAAASPYSLVLLDVTLAQGNGFAVCTALKQALPQLPVIFLTASSDEFTTVAGIQMGADDYISKPFRPRELLARVAIDTDRAHVERNGCEVILSALEYRLLLLFATHQGSVITRDQIRDALWDDAGTYIEENTLSVYIKRLRDKIEDDPAHPRLIATVRGLGYKALG